MQLKKMEKQNILKKSIMQIILKDFLKNKLILKTRQRFKSERYNILTVLINKSALSTNDDKRMQSIDSTETCIWYKQRYNTCERKI